MADDNNDFDGTYYYSSETNSSNNNDDDTDGDFWESEEGINKYFVVFFSLLSLVLVLTKFLQDRPRLASILPEAGMTIIVGTIAGAVIFLTTPVSNNNDYYNNDNNNVDNINDIDDDSLFTGSVNTFVAAGLLSFSPKVFFFVLLPPIIFNSGYTLKRELFFRHIAPISLFACVGTAISSFVVACILQFVKWLDQTGEFKPHFTELLAFGSLISATDPVSTLAVFQAKQVDPQLFYLVFGESVLNDAVGLVLFKTCSKFVGKQDGLDQIFGAILDFFIDFSIGFVGSMIVGLGAGLVSALFLKVVDMRQHPLLELCLFFMIMYMPFFLAELLELSGIVTILFTGISARRYATANLTESTEEHANILFHLAAHIAETSIFLELGLSVFGLSASIKWSFVGWAILACLIGRALNIYPLRYVYNKLLLRTTMQQGNDNKKYQDTGLESVTSTVSMTHPNKKDLKVRNNTAHMLWFSGLRGAVAYSCAKTFPNEFGNRPNFVSTTIAIVFFTVFTFGCATEWALNYLQIEMYCDEEEYMQENKTLDKMDFINMFECKYIFPYVIRNYSGHHNSADVVEMQNMSAVTEEKNWTRPLSPTGVSRTSTLFTRDYYDGEIDNVQTWKKKNSLYDYGMGSSVRSYKGGGDSSVIS